MQRIDYHVHSTHSSDARSSMPDMVKRAVECGITEICFTDHIELNEGGLAFHYPNLKAIYEDIMTCRDAFAGKIGIKFGLELGQGIYQPAEYQKVIEAFPYDFLMSSVHRATGQEDYYVRSYRQQAVEDILLEYCREIETYIDTLDFDVFGHIDYPTRYLQRYGLRYDMRAFEPFFISAFEKLIEKGRGIELNISGLRDGFLSMPSLYLLKLYRACGGEILTIGSDSHHIDALGLNYEEGVQLAKEAGFHQLTIFERRQKRFVEI